MEREVKISENCIPLHAFHNKKKRKKTAEEERREKAIWTEILS